MKENNCFISLFLCHRSFGGDKLRELLDNIIETVANSDSIELLIKLDDNDENLEHIKASINSKKYIFHIKYLVQFLFHKAYDALMNIADKRSKIFSVLSDSFRFESKAWDNIILDNLNVFDHEIFCFRVSHHKYWKHRTIRQAWDHCENWGFYSKKWLEIVGGWGDFWCPDATQEMINFFLAKDYQTFVSVPFYNIKMSRIHSYNVDVFNAMLKWVAGELYFYRKMLSKNGLLKFKETACKIFLHASLYPEIIDKTELNNRKHIIKVFSKNEKLLKKKSFKISLFEYLSYCYPQLNSQLSRAKS